MTICEKCRAGTMVQFERRVGTGTKEVTLRGVRCDRCGYTSLDDDSDIWGTVGL